MVNSKPSEINKSYVYGVSAITFLMPIVSMALELLIESNKVFSLELLGKWFIFYVVGVRLFLAGINQITKPEFTAKEIFHLESPESLPIVRELGICVSVFN